MQAKFVSYQDEFTYPIHSPIWCDENGGLLDIDFEAIFDIDKIRNRPPTLWRYREAIPIESEENIVSFGEGFTPLEEVTIQGEKIRIKLDYLFPSGSYKDRGASILISQVKSLCIKEIIQDSSGNAGCAIANYAAKANIQCKIYVPADTSPAKLAQIAMYGAEVIKIKGSREETAQQALRAAAHTYYASHVWNPFFLQGTKTFAYEICEQLGWKAPDTLILPAGNGTLLLGAYIGFMDLKNAKIIETLPKLIGIQAESCNPLEMAFGNKQNILPPIHTQPTLAEGIAIAKPTRGQQMIQCIQNTNGFILSVSEEAITHSLQSMCKKGYYIEPTSAATIAGVEKYIHHHKQKNESIVSVFTGNGLKSTEKILKILEKK